MSEELIKNLCNDLEPCPEKSSLYKNMGIFLLAFVLCIAAGFSFIGIRSNIAERMDLAFLIENTLMVIAGLCATLAAFKLSTPDLKTCKYTKTFIAISVSIWVGLCLYAFIGWEEGYSLQEDMEHGSFCIADLFILGVLPGIILFAMIRKAAPVKLGLTGMMAFLAVGSFSAIASRYMCTMDNFAHLFLWHFLPVLVIGAIGLLIGKYLFKW